MKTNNVKKKKKKKKKKKNEREREHPTTKNKREQRIINNALPEIPACTLKAAQKRSVFVGLMMP